MSITDRFASSQGRRDQNPNKEFAKQLAQTNDAGTVREIIRLIEHGPKTDLLTDALKVLEIAGELNPKLIAPVFDAVFPLLQHKSNQVRWRVMTVIGNIATYHKSEIYDHLGVILHVMEQGSVVARDHGFKILTILYQNSLYEENLSPVMAELILSTPDNQVGQYAEKWLKVIRKRHIRDLVQVLQARKVDLSQPSHQKRIERVLLKLHKMNQQPNDH